MSWYSNIASRVNNSVSSLQRTVFNSEADGDTEDDTYVCRVLRQHYTEKGSGFPGWLPPDPKQAAPSPVTANPAISPRYGNVPASQSAGGLSSLWDKNRAAGGATAVSPSGVNARNPFAQRNAAAAAASPDQGSQGRPALPSQRSGSYQTTASSGSSIQDRLRGRLGGGARTTSPGNVGSPFSPPPAQGGSSGGGSGDYDPYRAGDYGSGGAAPPARTGGGLPSGPRRMGGLPSGPRMR